MLMVCVTVSGNNRQLSKNSARRALPQLQTPTLVQFTKMGYIRSGRTLIARVASAHRDTSESFKARSGRLASAQFFHLFSPSKRRRRLHREQRRATNIEFRV